MAVGAGTMLAIAGISALGSAAATGLSTYYGGKAADAQSSKLERLERDKMDMNDRQHRDNLRQRKKEHDYSKIGDGINNLASLGALRQNIGRPTASQRLLG